MENNREELNKTLAGLAKTMKKEGLSFIKVELELFIPKDGDITVKEIKITDKNGMSERV